MSSVWRLYVKSLTQGQTQSEIATQSDLAQTTVSRWLSGSYAPTEAAKVAAFARGYGRNVLEAFVAAGMLTEREAVGGLTDESRLLLKRVTRAARAEDQSVVAPTVEVAEEELYDEPSAAEPERRDEGEGDEHA